MYNYIKGKITALNPTELCIENNGIGYNIQISLQTFQAIQEKEDIQIFLHHHLREDDEQFYGFATTQEREIFRQLISVSGIGVNSARMILSSLNDEELKTAILEEDINRIKAVKGIGLKTAQRIIIDLKDKIIKGEDSSISIDIVQSPNKKVIEEASTALLMLGFNRASINKVIPDLVRKSPELKVEDVIKIALKSL